MASLVLDGEVKVRMGEEESGALCLLAGDGDVEGTLSQRVLCAKSRDNKMRSHDRK